MTTKRVYAVFLKAVFETTDEVQAAVIADIIRRNAERDLDTESGDTMDVTDVIPLSYDIPPNATAALLRAARNTLIHMRKTDCIATARELDQFAWAIEHSTNEPFTLAGYDHGKFMEMVEKVLKGERPA